MKKSLTKEESFLGKCMMYDDYYKQVKEFLNVEMFMCEMQRKICKILIEHNNTFTEIFKNSDKDTTAYAMEIQKKLEENKLFKK